MIKNYAYKNLNWIDVEDPTRDDAATLVKKYNLSPLVGDELLSPTRNPRIDIAPNYIFLSLQIPLRTNHGKKNRVVEKEIDFIVGKNFIITSHTEDIVPLHSFAKSFETNAILDKNGLGDHAGIIFYYILKKMYAHMRMDLENIKDALKNAEEHVFLGHEKKMVEVLSELSRELIDYKQTVRLHQSILESLKNTPKELFGSEFVNLAQEIQADYEAVHDVMTNCRELVSDLRVTNDSLLSAKQNENMRVFAILAFMTFPLTLLLQLFSLPTTHTPIIGLAYDWEIFAGAIIILSIIMLLYFKKKGWL